MPQAKGGDDGKEDKDMEEKKLALEKELKLDLAPKFRDQSTQASHVPRGSGRPDPLQQQGRATFRPPTADTGRPAYRPDLEDQVSDMRSIKLELTEAKKEVERLKTALLRSEAKEKEKERLVEQVLMEKSHVLPTRIAHLIEQCFKSAQNSKLQEAESTIAAQDLELQEMQGELERLQRTAGDKAGPMWTARTRSSPRQPWEMDFGDKGLNTSRSSSGTLSPAGGSSTARSSQMGYTARGKQGGGHKGDADAMRKAREEIEKLHRLVSAGETVRDGLQRRVETLEAEVKQLRGKENEGTGMQKSTAEIHKDSLFTEDGRDFENYIRRLANIPELPDAKKKNEVRVGMTPKVTTQKQREAAAAAELEKKKKDRQMLIYEVTCRTGPSEGSGTTANCWITLKGEYGEYGPCPLERMGAEDANFEDLFKTGAKGVFDVAARDVGPIQSIVVGHDGSGGSPAWWLQAVTVRKLRTEKEDARSYEFYFDEWIAADKGQGTLQVELFPTSKQHRGSAKDGDVAKGGRPGSAKGKGAPASVIDKEEVGKACRNTIKAVVEMHLAREVVKGEHQHGLKHLGSLLGLDIQQPSTCRNLVVFLVGPRKMCTQFINWYGGCAMSNTGFGTESCFTYVSGGTEPKMVKGAAAELGLGHVKGICSAVPNLGASFCVETVRYSDMRFAQVDFIHPPVIEGRAKGVSDTMWEAMEEIRKELTDRMDSLRTTFKQIDTDNNESLDLEEFKAAMQLLNVHMSPTRAKHLFGILDVSGDGAIEYEEFLAAFRPSWTKYDYELEDAIYQAGRHADVIVTLIDPKSVHYNARELHAYKRLYENFSSKLKLACFLRDNVRTDTKLKSHLLKETRSRLESLIGLEPNRLPELDTIFIPTEQTEREAAITLVENRMDQVLRAIAGGLLEIETRAVEATHDNIRAILDGLWSSGEQGVIGGVRALLAEWLRVWSEASARRKAHSIILLNKVCGMGLKDLQRGHVIEEDIEAWTPLQVVEWLKRKDPLLEKYAPKFEVLRVTGRKLITLTEHDLKTNYGVLSLGHRKELMRHIKALIIGRRNWLKQ